LSQEVARLRSEAPDDSFEAFMKLTALDASNDNSVARIDQLMQDHKKKPANIRLQYQPRIRCHDCPGKFYKAGDVAGEGQNLQNFAVHLKNRKHKAHVEERIKSGR
jgi:SWI/SNF-related matrix-associated actin-dependent regulator of chromatin subfamily B protein 1